MRLPADSFGVARGPPRTPAATRRHEIRTRSTCGRPPAVRRRQVQPRARQSFARRDWSPRSTPSLLALHYGQPSCRCVLHWFVATAHYSWIYRQRAPEFSKSTSRCTFRFTHRYRMDPHVLWKRGGARWRDVLKIRSSRCVSVRGTTEDKRGRSPHDVVPPPDPDRAQAEAPDVSH